MRYILFGIRDWLVANKTVSGQQNTSVSTRWRVAKLCSVWRCKLTVHVYSTPRSNKWLPSSGFLAKTLYAFPMTAARATYSGHLLLLLAHILYCKTHSEWALRLQGEPELNTAQHSARGKTAERLMPSWRLLPYQITRKQRVFSLTYIDSLC